MCSVLFDPEKSDHISRLQKVFTDFRGDKRLACGFSVLLERVRQLSPRSASRLNFGRTPMYPNPRSSETVIVGKPEGKKLWTRLMYQSCALQDDSGLQDGLTRASAPVPVLSKHNLKCSTCSRSIYNPVHCQGRPIECSEICRIFRPHSRPLLRGGIRHDSVLRIDRVQGTNCMGRERKWYLQTPMREIPFNPLFTNRVWKRGQACFHLM
jgi:hypothetical protein